MGSDLGVNREQLPVLRERPDTKSFPLRLRTSEVFITRLLQKPHTFPDPHLWPHTSAHTQTAVLGAEPTAYLGSFCFIFLKVCEQLAQAEKKTAC